MVKNTILCVKWGDKYGNEYVERVKRPSRKKLFSAIQFLLPNRQSNTTL